MMKIKELNNMKREYILTWMALCAILKENLLKNKSITWFRLLLIKVFFKGYISIGNPNRNFPQSRLDSS
jgi:uncharacterized membrane protein YwzB